MVCVTRVIGKKGGKGEGSVGVVMVHFIGHHLNGCSIRGWGS
jgi:hypothetical protein